MADQIGSIAPGLQADIVAFDCNPLQDVNAAGRAVFVMKAGKMHENLAHGAKDRPRLFDSSVPLAQSSSCKTLQNVELSNLIMDGSKNGLNSGPSQRVR